MDPLGKIKLLLSKQKPDKFSEKDIFDLDGDLEWDDENFELSPLRLFPTMREFF